MNVFFLILQCKTILHFGLICFYAHVNMYWMFTIFENNKAYSYFCLKKEIHSFWSFMPLSPFPSWTFPTQSSYSADDTLSLPCLKSFSRSSFSWCASVGCNGEMDELVFLENTVRPSWVSVLNIIHEDLYHFLWKIWESSRVIFFSTSVPFLFHKS